eukprot:367386-Amphidinium_carterae.1
MIYGCCACGAVLFKLQNLSWLFPGFPCIMYHSEQITCFGVGMRVSSKLGTVAVISVVSVTLSVQVVP